MSTLILVASVLGLAFGIIYTLFKPHWAILLILIFYPMEQLMTTASPFFASNAKVLNLIVGGLAILGAASAVFGGKRPFRGFFNPIWFCTMILFGWAIMGIFFSPEPSSGIEDLIIGIPYLGLLLFFPPFLLNRLEDYRRLVVPAMAVGSAIIVLILLSPKTTMWGGRLGIEGTGGADGPEILNPLSTAGLGGTIVIFGLLYKPDRRVVFVNLIRLTAIITGLVIALLSGSRGQLVGAIFCGIVMFPLARQIKNITQFLTVSGSAFVSMAFIVLVLNMATTRDSATRYTASALSDGVNGRARMAGHMLSEWINNPVAFVQGLGTSSFDFYWTQTEAPYIHNMPIQILTENGLVGVMILTVLMLFVARAAFQILKVYADSPRELSTAAILVAICGYDLLLTLKQGNWFTSGAPFWTFLILAKIHARTMAEINESGQLAQLQHDYEYEYEEEFDYEDGHSVPAM